MGWRFRKSIKILPGVRLNVTTRGLSATLGPRGTSVSVGRLGVHGNVGLPGTGVSFRQRLDLPAAPGSTARSSYRELVRQQREAERHAEATAAAQEHAASEATLNSLRDVLRNRVNAPYLWEQMWAPLPFEPRSFAEPERQFSPATVERDAREAHPTRLPKLLVGAALTVTAWNLRTLAWQPPTVPTAVPLLVVAGALVVAIGSAVAIGHQNRRRAQFRLEQTKELESQYHDEVQRARAVFMESERTREQQWQMQEQHRLRVRSAPEREDLEVMAGVLEDELKNEEIPVPLVFEIEFESSKIVRMEMALPDLADLPTERTTLTKTGKLSLKAFARRDRVALYEDLCTGVAIRVIYEVFRVLPTVQQVELLGTVEEVDPATGHSREFVTLHILTNRESCDRLEFDRIDASAAFDALGGDFSLRRTGQLGPLPGLERLGDTAD